MPFYAVSQGLFGCNRMPFGLLGSPDALQRLIVRCIVILETDTSFFFLAQNIDCGYTLEMSRRGRSNEYPRSMFWIRKIGIPLQPPSRCVSL